MSRHLNPVHILHLEDNDRDAELLTGLIQAGDYEVDIHRVISDEGFRTALEQQDFDLILSDYTIPGYSGIAALRWAREVAPEIPFIFLSGTMGEDLAVESLLEGATDYILKHRPARLSSAIARALEERSEREKRKAAESNASFQANILRNVTEGVIVVTFEGEIVFWNSGAAKLLGVTENEALALNVSDLPSIGRPLAELLIDVSYEGDASADLPIQSEEGAQEWLLVKGSWLLDQEDYPTGVLFIAKDISERKRSEESVRRMNAELERRVAERTSELTEANDDLKAFAYTVSHDLKTPLRAILGFSHILLEDYFEKLEPEAQGLLDRVTKAAAHMDQLLVGLLELSIVMRQDSYRKRVNLSSTARDIAAQLSATNPTRNVTWIIEPDLEGYGDERLMQSLLANLLGNAWKFSAETPAAVIEFGKTVANGRDAFYVKDNGVGFNPEEAHRIFQPFARLHVDEGFSGTGIGLATVRRIIQRHEGEVWCDGKAGQGATLYFTLSSDVESLKLP